MGVCVYFAWAFLLVGSTPRCYTGFLHEPIKWDHAESLLSQTDKGLQILWTLVCLASKQLLKIYLVYQGTMVLNLKVTMTIISWRSGCNIVWQNTVRWSDCSTGLWDTWSNQQQWIAFLTDSNNSRQTVRIWPYFSLKILIIRSRFRRIGPYVLSEEIYIAPFGYVNQGIQLKMAIICRVITIENFVADDKNGSLNISFSLCHPLDRGVRYRLLCHCLQSCGTLPDFHTIKDLPHISRNYGMNP